MSRETERAAIADHFKDVGWLAADGDVAWPNQPFKTPDNNLFCVFSLVERGTFRRSIGRRFFKRCEGTLQVDIYTPQNQGTKKSREITDRLEDIYEMLELPTSDGEMVIFGTPSTRVLDPNVVRATNLDDNWDRYMFEVPYHRDVHVEK